MLMNKDIKHKELKNRLSSKEIDNLVLQYRQGSIEAAEKLLETFSSLIGKYLNLIFYGIFNENDRDIVAFLNACGKLDIHRTAEIIRYRLRKYEAEELIDICKIALLDTAKHYINISGSYKYVLHNYLKNMLWEDFPDGMPSIEPTTEDFLGHYMKKADTKIDEEWIKGNTSGAGFSDLTEEQRNIVKLAWIDKLSSEKICKKLSLTLQQLELQKEEIRIILAKRLNIRKHE